MSSAQSKPEKQSGDMILAQLGQGGMARVELAVRFGPGGFRKLYVIKRLRRDIANDAYANMFMHEARLAALLSHPNVVQSHEVNQEIGDCYLKMEYLDGQTLARLVRRVNRSQLPLEVHLYVLTELLAGLHYAHELKDLRGNPLEIVHRDVSPGNLFLTYDGQVKLLDFGIAQSAEAVDDQTVGAIKGKIKYMSPEQAHGVIVDRRSDLYSVGVMLWEAIACGPFVPKGPSSKEIIERRRKGEYTPIEKVVPNVPPRLAAICKKALSLDPNQRYSTAEEFRESLLAELATMPLRPTREDVAGVVQTQFKEERMQVDAMIGNKIALGADGETVIFPHTIPGVQDVRAANAANPEFELPKHSKSKAPWLVASLLVLGGVGAATWIFLGAPENQDAVEDVVERQPAQRAPAPDPVVERSPDGSIKLTVRVHPDQASIVLDGEKIGVGLVRHRFERDEKKHRLVIEHPGFKSVKRSMIFDSDTRLEFSLVKLKQDASPEATKATTEPKKSVVKKASSRKTSSSRSSSKKAQAKPKAEPTKAAPPRKREFGEDLKGSSRSRQRKIDRENPYS